MEHYVTLFDSLFLPQGLALHASMQRHAGTYTLWVLCMDEGAYDSLSRLSLPNVRPVALADVETQELLTVKPGRSRGEYCWTLTPFTPALVFEREPAARRVTYIDADFWLRSSPLPVFESLQRSGKAVLITEHAYAPEFDQTATSGRFCVQFTTFERERGESVRQWWAARCIEWCFARIENGKFGDQKYLDSWPDRFGDLVHVLEHREWMQGPWNTGRFAADDAIGFHFHGLRLLRDRHVLLTNVYPIYPSTRRTFYEPYQADLQTAIDRLSAVGVSARPQIDSPLWEQKLRLLAQHGSLALRRLVRDQAHRVVRLG